MTSTELSLLVLKTQQLDVVKSFYEHLGIEFEQERHGEGPVHYAARLGQLVFELYPANNDLSDSTTRVGFVVEELQDKIDNLVQNQLASSKTPKQTPWGLRVVVRDPDGRAVELYQK